MNLLSGIFLWFIGSVTVTILIDAIVIKFGKFEGSGDQDDATTNENSMANMFLCLMVTCPLLMMCTAY
jgi:hypothetical protein